MEAASDRVTPKEEALAYVHMVADASPGGSAEPSSAPPRDNALDQMKLFDMKKVQPPQFSGRPSDWQEFRFRLWILMEVVGIAALMKMAEDRGTLGEVTVEEQHETVQARSRLLYLLLSQSLGGKALTILRGVHHANGLEAWRRLTLEYEPRTVARSTAMLTGILTPKWKDIAVGEFMEAILQWEKRVEDYDDMTGLPLGDAVKVAVVTQYAPAPIRKFLQLSPVEYVRYAELREAVRVYLQRARSFDPLGIVTAPCPMEVGEVARGRGDGRGRGKGRGGGGQAAYPSAAGRGRGSGAGRGGRGAGWSSEGSSWWRGGAGAQQRQQTGAGAQQRQQALAASKERVGARPGGTGVTSSGGGTTFQGTCVRCQKWGHKAAQCRAPWEKCPAASKKVNEVAEEEYVLMVVPGEEEMKGDIEEKLEEDIVWKEAVSLDETGLARSEDLRAMFAEEVAEATTGIAKRGVPGSCRYFGQDHDATWLPGDLEFTSDEVNRARSSLQEYEPCSVMAVEESPLTAGDELAVSVLIDSGAYLHVCPPSFAPTVPVEETAPIVAQSASGKALKYYGQKAVDLITQEGCRLSVVFAVFNVTKPILSAGMMRLRGHSVWLGVNPSLTCGRRRISLKEKGNLFYLTA